MMSTTQGKLQVRNKEKRRSRQQESTVCVFDYARVHACAYKCKIKKQGERRERERGKEDYKWKSFDWYMKTTPAKLRE